MEIQVREQIEALRHMTVGQLREKYSAVFGEETRSHHKQFLFRRIAWRIQALAEGGLSERARRRALEIANDADLRIQSPRGFDVGMPRDRRVNRRITATDPRLPAPGTLHGLLTNVIFTGKVDFQGTIYPGKHEAIIDQAVWDQVQTMLRRNGQPKGASTRNKYAALLRGLLFCAPCGTAMVHSYTARHSKRYRYYVCYQAQQRGWKNCETKSVSAPAIEAAVLESIRKLGVNPELASETARQVREQIASKAEDLRQQEAMAQKQLQQLHAEPVRLAGDGSVDSSARFDRLLALQTETQAVEQHLAAVGAEFQELQNDPFDERDLIAALKQFEPVWASLTTREQVQLINLVIEKVGYDGRTGKVSVSFRSAGLRQLCNGTNDSNT